MFTPPIVRESRKTVLPPPGIKAGSAPGRGIHAVLAWGLAAKELQELGKTLSIQVSQFLTLLRQLDMARILSQIARFLSVNTRMAPAGDTADVARQLMERAQSRAGRNPYQAQELRNAASAYLSVIR